MEKLSNAALNRITIETFKKSYKTPLIIVLDNVRSLHNIGSIFRTCDAFRIQKLYLCGITATPPHKDIYKTALGATQSVDWEYRENICPLIEELNEQNIVTIAIEQAKGSQLLHQFKVENNKTYCLVFGNEVKGVAQEVINRCQSVIEIPQLGIKHSLNVSVSCGVVLWDLSRQLGVF